MGKLYKHLIICALVGGVTPLAAHAESFSLFEDFDSSTSIPEGWLAEGTSPNMFAVYPASWCGVTAPSGDNILFSNNSPSASRDEILYTPKLNLAGGKTVTVSFDYCAPGGTPPTLRCVGLKIKAGTEQTAESQTIEVGEIEQKAYADWTPFTFSFTPEEDAELCLSFQVYSTVMSAGFLFMDNIEIEGESPSGGDIELEPDPENEADAVELPYIEDFEGDNYDGTGFLPVKWFASGTNPFTTASLPDFKANSGEWYLVTQNSDVERDERLYTPFFVLTAGTEYTVSYYLYIPGQEWGSDGVTRTTDLKFTVGTQQEADFHNTLESITDYTNSAWERREVRFTPDKSGAYCFSFALSSASPYAGPVAIDDFSITANGLIPSPKAKFAVHHIYDLQTGNLAVYPKQPVQLVNLSQYGEEYQWTVDSETATFDDASAYEPTLTFSEGGTYKITLAVKNSKTERSTTKTIEVNLFNEGGEQSLNNYAGDDKLYTRGSVPVFGTSETDFISGPNHYYRRYAERVVLPSDVDITLDQIGVWYTNIHYKTINNSRDQQFNTKFELVVCGETADGKPDESKEFGRYSSTMAETFGTTGVGTGYGEALNIIPETPIKVDGNCWLVFDIDEAFDLEVDDPNVGASYMGLAAVKHASEKTTLYANPYALPETSDATVGEWVPVDLIDAGLKGFGIASVLWVTTEFEPEPNSIAVNSLGEIVFDVRVDGDNLLVSGTRQGEAVKVYDTKGSLVAQAVAGDNVTVVPVGSLTKGVYIVSAGDKVSKIVK